MLLTCHVCISADFTHGLFLFLCKSLFELFPLYLCTYMCKKKTLPQCFEPTTVHVRGVYLHSRPDDKIQSYNVIIFGVMMIRNTLITLGRLHVCCVCFVWQLYLCVCIVSVVTIFYCLLGHICLLRDFKLNEIFTWLQNVHGVNYSNVQSLFHKPNLWSSAIAAHSAH